MCSIDLDPCDVFKLSSPRAKRRHRCDECGVDILPRETYQRATWLSDGSWGGSVRCNPCSLLAGLVEDLICCEPGGIPWGGGQLDEEVTYIYGPAGDWAREQFDAIKNRIFEARP